MTNKLSPEQSWWGWKLLIVASILALLFMLIFYWAINNEPDYMPSQNNKQMMESHEQMNHAEMHSSSAQ
ncbi:MULTISPECIES: NADH-quinone oxidoreductase subunit J [unclassified Acinetobacter]|uniref:NADH-quinone oxidoreductase subunit J n=1 Tax=unclassified Acinetobacter TaxID=196816 RepID=UPI0003128D8E|nr:NADH-quinone oxidoreductase subunit J [Acinetobacter sp. GG2]